MFKITAVYGSLACLPPEFSSSLENIFLIQLHNSNSRKLFGNKNVFKELLTDLKLLESDGILIKNGNISERVYFVLLLIIGDNLGLNQILGFQESFNSNFFCRFCRLPKSETATQIYDEANMLRTVNNYENDICELITGVKEICIWNELPSFHVAINISCDIMHDILEGICRYEFGEIIFHYIYIIKIFTLDTLNARLLYFSYNGYSNKLPVIQKRQVLNKLIILSASEMHVFLEIFSLLIGDLVPEGGNVWDLYLSLRQLFSIVNSKIICPGYSDLLRTLVAEHKSS